MTVPVSKTTNVSSSINIFESFDRKLCRTIFHCLYEDFQAFLSKGIDPDYCLKEDISLGEEKIVFSKGCSLIFIIVQSCTVTVSPWDLWMMMNLLLDRNVDLEKKFDCVEGQERTRGGGSMF